MLESEQEVASGTKELFQIPLSSGVIFPAWDLVKSDAARASLIDTLGVLRMTKRWGGMRSEEDLLRKSILHHFAMTGLAPSLSDLATFKGHDLQTIRRLLTNLEDRDLIVLDANGMRIEGAYPFTSRKTEHRMHFGGKDIYAMCAIDALGTGAMLGRDTAISSKCRFCECSIEIKTEDQGRSIRSGTPGSTVVWAGIQEIDGCAANTQCQVMAFFCSDDHLKQWKEAQDDCPTGHRLSLDEGLEAGAAIFVPFLASGHDAYDLNEVTN